MKLRISIAVLLVLGAVLVVGASMSSSATSSVAVVPENAVVFWSGIAEAAISAPPPSSTVPPSTSPRPPASSSVLAGMVHGAIYDAVAAVEGDLEPFATDVSAPPEASADAAVARAALDVLKTRVPGQAATVQAAYDTFIATIPDTAGDPGDPDDDYPRTKGIAVGAAAAAGMLALRTGDHFDAVVPYVQPPIGPGVFQPIASTPPVDTKLPFVRPFTFSAPSEYRPDAPYDLTSERYAADLAEVQAVGRVNSAVRTAEQTATARFYSDHTFKQYSRVMRDLVKAQGLDLRESARLLGYTWVAVGDTMISCFEAKYHYMFWRPNHAVSEAGWAPLLTGNHPEYPSGHSCFTAGVSTSLREYFGKSVPPIVVNSTTSNTPRTYTKIGDWVTDVENARVWGGLHYRTTMTESAKHFPRIAKDVGKQYFLEGSKHDKGHKK